MSGLGAISAPPGRLTDRFDDASVRSLLEAARAVLQSGSLRSVELHEVQEGTPRELTARLGPYVERRVVVWVRDVTAKSRLVAELSAARATALEAARLKTKFLANMSHEIRTPMNGVIGMTNLLLETPLSVEQNEYAQIIQKSGQTLLLIIDDILDFAKIEAGKLELEEVEFELSACIDACVEACAGQAQAKGLELGAVYEAGVPSRVRGDPTRLRQILANLLSNAVRCTDVGAVVVRVGVQALVAGASASTRLRISVQDSGPGIARERLPQLFQPVLLGDVASVGSGAGTGLGLVIARELVQLMGGEIECRSNVGQGSTFEFTLRLGVSTAARGSTPEPALGAGEGAWVGTVRSGGGAPWLLTDQLSEFDVPWVALDPQQVVSELLAQPRARPCLALLVDARLPPALLAQLVSALRREPRSAAVPLLLVAGYQSELPDALRAEAARVLSWPVRQSELRACLLALQQQRSGTPPSEPRKPNRSGPLRARVLVADDDEINQRVLRRALSQLGCSAEFAADGQSAVERALAGEFDVILMDCQMPWLDGFEAARRIRAAERGTHKTPIVAMTGSTSDDDRRLSLEVGMDGFLVKPVSLELLSAELRRLIPRRGDVEELVEALVRNTPRNLEAMRAALDVRDFGAVARAARQLGGLAEALEEELLRSACAELVGAAELADLAASEQALERTTAQHALTLRRWR